MIDQLLNDIRLAEERLDQAEIALMKYLTKRYKARLYTHKGLYVVMPRGQKPADQKYYFGNPMNAWLSFAARMQKEEQSNAQRTTDHVG